MPLVPAGVSWERGQLCPACPKGGLVFGREAKGRKGQPLESLEGRPILDDQLTLPVPGREARPWEVEDPIPAESFQEQLELELRCTGHVPCFGG